VQPEPKPLEREFWKRRDVDVHEVPLEQYVGDLARYADIELDEAAT
jgi:ferric-dicitrate binding protein FerR (iron transport regulator)